MTSAKERSGVMSHETEVAELRAQLAAAEKELQSFKRAASDAMIHEATTAKKWNAAVARADRLEAELRNIADAKPGEWEPDMRDQFREWAQNRARQALRPPSPATPEVGEADNVLP